MPLLGEGGDDPAMLLMKPRRDEGVAKPLPLQRGIGHEAFAFCCRKGAGARHEVSDGLFYAVVGRRQFQLGIEDLQMAAEFRAHEGQGIRGGLSGGSGFAHGGTRRRLES